MAGAALLRVLSRLHGAIAISPGEGNTEGWKARCPAHDDQHQSLQVTERFDQSVGLHCHAGCSKADLLSALGLTFSDLYTDAPVAATNGKPTIVQAYDYKTLDGALLYQAVRYYPKDFRQRRPDPDKPGKWIWNLTPLKNKHVVYRLPDLRGHNRVVIVEGEKDADKLWTLGIPATTNIGGAEKWTAGETASLKKAGVTSAVVIPDNDDAGHKHEAKVTAALTAAGLTVQVLNLPHLEPHGDVSDWLGNGGSPAGLQALIDGLCEVPAVPEGDAPESPPVSPVLPDEPSLPYPMSYTITGPIGRGAAEAFRDRFGDRLRYDHARECWFVWDQHRWRRDVDEEVMRLAVQHSRLWVQEVLVAATDFTERKRWTDYTMKLERRPDRVTMLADARSVPPFKDTPRWDADPWVMGVPNGVVDLRTGQLRDGQQSDAITLHTGVAYNPGAECPRWLQFLNEVFDNDAALIDFIHQYCGYCLTGRTSEQIVVFFYGIGRNGKGRFLHALRNVMGEYAAVLPFSSLTISRNDSSNDLAALQGKRFVMASEVNEGARLNEARIKALTGEDPITARFLFKEYRTFVPVAKYMLAVNHKPVVKDDSEGFWRRVRLVPFTKQFTGAACDPALDETLQQEWPGILAWAVQGCLEWQAAARLPEPQVMMDATKEYELDSDPLEEFLGTECEALDPEDDPDLMPKETGTAMFSAYIGWCDATQRSKQDRLTSTAFGLALSMKLRKSRQNGRVVYHGVRLKPRTTGSLYDDE